MPQIKETFFEDHKGDISFFYNGKNNVIGLQYPDAVITNAANHNYIKIAMIDYDESLQYSEENVIDETFALRIENNKAAQYAANSVNVKLLGHVTGKRVTKEKFKCIITPELEYLGVPELIITEEPYTSPDNIQCYRVCVWLNSTNIKRIYTSKVLSHARNTVPVNAPYIDSRYYFYLMDNDTIVPDVDTADVESVVKRYQFTTGISIYKPIDTRLTSLEGIRYPDIKSTVVNYDTTWVPDTDGTDAVNYQLLPPVNSNYGLSLSNSFIKLHGGSTKGISVTEAGLYMFQIASGMDTMSATEDSDIELSLQKNSEYIHDGSLQYKLIADKGSHYVNPIGFVGGSVVLNLTTSDIIRLRYKALTTPRLGVMNRGTKLYVTKLIQDR